MIEFFFRINDLHSVLKNEDFIDLNIKKIHFICASRLLLAIINLKRRSIRASLRHVQTIFYDLTVLRSFLTLLLQPISIDNLPINKHLEYPMSLSELIYDLGSTVFLSIVRALKDISNGSNVLQSNSKSSVVSGFVEQSSSFSG